MHNVLVLAVGIHQMWYAAPLIVSVSLVYAATRHEFMMPILHHALRFATWITGFMIAVLIVLAIVSRLV